MSTDIKELFPGRVFISTALDALEAKTALSGELTRRYLQRAAMAGILIGIFYVAYFATLATFDQVVINGESTLRPVGKVVGALVFGWALVFIYYTRSELLTSNMMIVSVGRYHRRTTARRALRLLGLCYLGNLLGGLVVAGLLALSSITSGPVLAEMSEAVAHKTEYLTSGVTGWADLLVRAILCNLLINLAMLLVYNGLIHEDFTKSLAMVMSVFLFAFTGLEHSVANTVLFSVVALQEGVPFLPAVGNIALALIGNFIGGGLLIGMYYAYVNDEADYLRHHPTAGSSTTG